MQAAARRAWRHGVRGAKWEAVLGSADNLAVELAFLAVLAVGVARVASGDMPVSTLIAFLLYLFYLMEPVYKLVEAASHYQEGAAAIARIAQVDGLATEKQDRHRPVRPAANQAVRPRPASVRFEEVSFRYGPGSRGTEEALPEHLPGPAFGEVGARQLPKQEAPLGFPARGAAARGGGPAVTPSEAGSDTHWAAPGRARTEVGG